MLNPRQTPREQPDAQQRTRHDEHRYEVRARKSQRLRGDGRILRARGRMVTVGADARRSARAGPAGMARSTTCAALRGDLPTGGGIGRLAARCCDRSFFDFPAPTGAAPGARLPFGAPRSRAAGGASAAAPATAGAIDQFRAEDRLLSSAGSAVAAEQRPFRIRTGGSRERTAIAGAKPSVARLRLASAWRAQIICSRP